MKSWVLLFVCITCVMGVCNDENKTRDTFIAYSLDGGICSGLYRIDVDQSNSFLEATALLIPAANGDPEVVILTFYDYAIDNEVLFTIPLGDGIAPENGYGFGDEYGMGILHAIDSCNLTSGAENFIGGVSFSIEKFKRGNGIFGFQSVEELEVHFEGIMSEKNHPGGGIVYTINGDFYYREQF